MTIGFYSVVEFANIELIRPHNCEVEVLGRPQSRIPDLTLLDDVHLTLMDKRLTITRKMPPPRVVVEVVSPGSESSENYKRDYQDKRDQYADRGIPEYWFDGCTDIDGREG